MVILEKKGWVKMFSKFEIENFDKQIEIESKHSPTCFGVSFDSTKALKIRAPSKCNFKLCFLHKACIGIGYYFNHGRKA